MSDPAAPRMRGLLRALGSSTISNRKIARRAGFNEILPCRSDSSAVGGGLSSVLTAFRNTVCSVSDTAEMTSESGTRARAPLTFARAQRPRACRLVEQAACQEPANADITRRLAAFDVRVPAWARALRGQNHPPERRAVKSL